MTIRGRRGGNDGTTDRPRRHLSQGHASPGFFFFVSLGPLAIHPMPMSACS
jgi:hypothetical protein